MARDVYKSKEAKAIREAVAKTGEIVREFGDPNNGNYIDPWGTMPEPNLRLDPSGMFPSSGGLHVSGVPRDAQGFRISS